MKSANKKQSTQLQGFESHLKQKQTEIFTLSLILLKSLRKKGLKPGMWKRLFFKRFRFRFHTYRFRFHQQKTKKRPLTIFFNFCGSVACLLLHFIILRKQKPSFIAITLPTSLKLIVSNYSVFLFLRYQNSR